MQFNAGGVLYVLPKVAEWVRRGDVIAEITDVYGRPIYQHVCCCAMCSALYGRMHPPLTLLYLLYGERVFMGAAYAAAFA
jgi:hypothetical protein